MSSLSRADAVFLAKVCESSERYQDMCHHMKAVALQSTADAPLTVEERNLLSVAYKNIIGNLRTTWRVISAVEQKQAQSQSSPSQPSNSTDAPSSSADAHAIIIYKYKEKIESELNAVVADVLDVLDKYLIETAENAEAKVFMLKMKGDYHRYVAEFVEQGARQSASDNALEAYKKASEIAVASLPSTHPIRLGLALNFSVYFYEVVGSEDRACHLAKQAFDDAISELDTLSEESYKDSTLIMQLLRDNLTLWTQDARPENASAAAPSSNTATGASDASGTDAAAASAATATEQQSEQTAGNAPAAA